MTRLKTRNLSARGSITEPRIDDCPVQKYKNKTVFIMLDAEAAHSNSFKTEHDRGFPVMCCFEVLQGGCGRDSLNVLVVLHHIPVY
mgnify:FL=1